MVSAEDRMSSVAPPRAFPSSSAFFRKVSYTRPYISILSASWVFAGSGARAFVSSAIRASLSRFIPINVLAAPASPRPLWLSRMPRMATAQAPERGDCNLHGASVHYGGYDHKANETVRRLRRAEGRRGVLRQADQHSRSAAVRPLQAVLQQVDVQEAREVLRETCRAEREGVGAGPSQESGQGWTRQETKAL